MGGLLKSLSIKLRKSNENLTEEKIKHPVSPKQKKERKNNVKANDLNTDGNLSSVSSEDVSEVKPQSTKNDHILEDAAHKISVLQPRHSVLLPADPDSCSSSLSHTNHDNENHDISFYEEPERLSSPNIQEDELRKSMSSRLVVAKSDIFNEISDSSESESEAQYKHRKTTIPQLDKLDASELSGKTTVTELTMNSSDNHGIRSTRSMTFSPGVKPDVSNLPRNRIAGYAPLVTLIDDMKDKQSQETRQHIQMAHMNQYPIDNGVPPVPNMTPMMVMTAYGPMMVMNPYPAMTGQHVFFDPTSLYYPQSNIRPPPTSHAPRPDATYYSDHANRLRTSRSMTSLNQNQQLDLMYPSPQGIQGSKPDFFIERANEANLKKTLVQIDEKTPKRVGVDQRNPFQNYVSPIKQESKNTAYLETYKERGIPLLQAVDGKPIAPLDVHLKTNLILEEQIDEQRKAQK
ncbi:hypothetical protein O9G_003688 [Rozella allomycis CSF55]|uniref:Uncharacterized protein n=1 Tax=Rozella allomycis (strain CSF55) TaxID=988480 RepID=A0A075AZ65_ROZAC|nr:hypothetical protein O9G_003688 [Rozella allomycis CSF55]|eukprot:EPZ35429.1 hypothetical protein O9G_003688 [Rozella allomycis CSF55]